MQRLRAPIQKPSITRVSLLPAQIADSSIPDFSLYGRYLQTENGFAPAPRAPRRGKIQNAFVTSSSGAMNGGDRSAGMGFPLFTSNPYTSNDFVYKWRTYVQMYETCWEARKIVNIPVDDALRKSWIVEGIPEEMAVKLQNRLDQMGFLNVLKRACKLEKLLGGCLAFFGLEATEDNVETAYHPREGAMLRFCNAIPISRIARVTWDSDPLSQGYMRPQMFMVNGQHVHISRCLVFDGNPLFDPYDFALTQFRANLAGFGPSVLAPLWDDIGMAVGTRQAAYQLIQVNNSIIAAISDLQDLLGTNAGQANIEKVKQIANQMSLYRAAIIAGDDKVQLSQHSASFGSVPELILTYLQVLSAASDIPATRFLGQAPGGLNATGESDLENYYNAEDAYQHLSIEPKLRRIYDVLGYHHFPKEWSAAREKLTFNFPPLWNQTEKEEAERNGLNIDNMIKLVQERMISEEKAIEELALKKAFSVKFTLEDLELLANERDEADLRGAQGQGGEQQDQNENQNIDPRKEIERIKNSWQVLDKIVNSEGYADLIQAAGGNPGEFDPVQFARGLSVEQEHWNTTSGDEIQMAKIVIDHLRERSDYYTRLERVENQINLSLLPEPTEAQIRAGNYPKHHIRLHGLDISVENPKGSIRRGTDANGNAWESKLPAHYGYIRKTEGADAPDQVDVFIGPHEESLIVYVIDQIDYDSGKFDEHKVILGCRSMAEAERIYLSAFSDGKPRIGAISPMSIEDFKGWLKDGIMSKPFGRIQNSGTFHEEDHPRADDGKFGSGGGKSSLKSDKAIGTKKSTESSTNKVVDKKGKPLVVYHGSDDEETDFGAYSGYFTTEKDYAHAYGEHVRAYHIDIKKPLVIKWDIDKGPSGDEPYINKASMIKALKKIDPSLEKDLNKAFKDIESDAEQEPWAYMDTDGFRNVLKKHGYDGFFAIEKENKIFRPISPDQIKKI